MNVDLIHFFGNKINGIQCNYVYDRFFCVADIEDLSNFNDKEKVELLKKIRENFDETGLNISENITGYFM